MSFSIAGQKKGRFNPISITMDAALGISIVFVLGDIDKPPKVG
jgi:hypothetical protein